MTTTAYIALGSNLAEPEIQLRRALAALNEVDGVVLRAVSSFYRTAPVGYLAQPDFVNAVACVQTELAPLALLHVLHDIEAAAGRERHFRNAPRTLDLDIIDYGGQISDDETLHLPHPRAWERGFVMVPLAEIAPDFCLPPYGITAQARAVQLVEQGVVKMDEAT